MLHWMGLANDWIYATLNLSEVPSIDIGYMDIVELKFTSSWKVLKFLLILSVAITIYDLVKLG